MSEPSEPLEQNSQPDNQIEQRVGINSGIVIGQFNGGQIIIQASKEILSGIGLITSPSKALEVGENPYQGLEAFQEKDADRFFGRASQIELLRELKG
jgi:hypothetical protein